MPNEDEEYPHPDRLDPDFLGSVFSGLSDTNFGRGWVDKEMYQDFLRWCEGSEEADEIITKFFPQVPTLLVDPEEGVRMLSLRADVATELMKALLDAFEQRRIEDFLNR